MSDPETNLLHLDVKLASRVALRRMPVPQSKEDALRLQDCIEQLTEAASADNHTVLFPSHVFVKGEEIVGYASVATMPVLNFWADSTKLHAADSVRMIEQGEAVCSHAGIRTMIVPCAEDSPFAAHMERLGYTKLGTTVLYRKEL
jgi:hypothetical protein